MPIMALNTDLHQLEDEATPVFTPIATSESSLFSYKMDSQIESSFCNNE